MQRFIKGSMLLYMLESISQVNKKGENMENRNFGERKMYKATCADCGKECEVPFQPQEGRPVYCKECYQKHRRY
jgi:CxxC-x17-CxxC domain-containing protein